MIKRFLIILLPILFAIVIDIVIHTLLHHDGELTEDGLYVVLFFCGILSYLFAEWIIFKIEWSSLEKDVNLVKMKWSVFLIEWETFKNCFEGNKAEWNDFKLKWEVFVKDFDQTKVPTSKTGFILNEFAESNFLMERIADSVKQDLQFDKIMKTDRKHLEFHLFLSKLKYNDFLTSHFIYSSENRLISRVPTHYFIQFIWRKLVEEFSETYSSLQILNVDTEEVYLKNDFRQNEEIGCLESQVVRRKKEAKLQSFHKLFVLKDVWMNEDKKEITNEVVKKYLKKWYDKLGQERLEKTGKIKLRIIKSSNAVGAIHKGPLDDIGIFGNLLGIQSVVENQERYFSADNIRIDFYFDETVVDKYKKDFSAIFNRAENLRDYFKNNLKNKV